MSFELSTRTGATQSLDDATIEAFGASLHGELVTPEDAHYDEARSIWNAMIDKRPGLIARCSGAADTISCLRFAATHDLLFSVRGAGHNIAGSSLSDGGLLIDHSLLRWVHVDPVAKTVRVGPGATLGDVDHETQAFGLAVPVGINSTTGIAGLTLGGGFGWLSRKFGLTIDSLLSVDVATAAGELITASESAHEDLFWAVRGGGGNFGVVTSFTYRLHEVGPELFCGLIVHRQADAPAVLERYRQYTAEAPDDMSVWAVLRKAPPLPFLPAEVHGTDVLVLPFVYAGDVSEGEKVIAPMRTFGQPVGEHVGAMPFTAFQQAFDPLLTPGARNYWKSHNFESLSDDAIGTVLRYASNLPSEHSEIFIASLGGAINRVPAEATAYAHRNVEYVMNVHTRWENQEADEQCIGWAREFFDATAPFATGGVYVNFMPEDETERTAHAYGPNLERLVRVKEKYDPENRFRRNQNIVPAS
jgi:FAD/FMN-containing dehydrogenase